MADSGTYDQATILRRQKIAEQMLADDSKPPVVKNWAQGLAHLGNIGADTFALNRLDAKAAESRKADTAALMAGIPDNTPTPSAAPSLAPSAPAAPKVIGMGGAPATPDAQGVYGADAVMLPPGADTSQPRGIRNNNPLNIEAGDFTKGQPGFTGSDGRFAQFAQPQQGVDAANKLLDTYQNKYGLNTVRGIIGRWAPSAEAGNNTSGYVASVAGRLGIDPDQPLTPEQRQPLIAAMGQFENGKPISGQAAIAKAMTPGAPMAFNGATPPAGAMPPGAPPAGAGAPPAAPPPGAAPSAPGAPAVPGAIPGASPGVSQTDKERIARLLSATPGSAAYQLGVEQLKQVTAAHNYTFQTLPDGTVLRMDPTGRTPPTPVYQAPVKPHFVPNIGPNQYGVAQPGFVDDLKGTATLPNITGAAGQPQSQAGDPNLTGKPFLETLDKQHAQQVQAIVEGRLSPPGSFALKTPYWQKMLADAGQYEPGFDFTKWGARAATAKDFASGKSAQNITSFNTAMGHLDTLDKTIDKLGNSDFPMYNSVANWVKGQSGNTEFQKAKTEFETARQAVTDELTRAFRGSGGNVHDIKGWEEKINAANSPAALHAATKSAVELLRSRIESVGDQYNRGMNTQTEPLKHLSPKAQAAYQRLSGEAPPPSPGETAAPTTAAPSAPSGQDKQALDWANANPNDPRAAAIKTRLGVQ